MAIETIADVLGQGESAVALYTAGPVLELRPDGTGSSGNWRMSLARRVDRVVIYRRHQDGRAGGDVIIADHERRSPSAEPGRVVVHFRGWVRCGSTRASWTDFAGPGQNPVRYVD